ncbi:MAG: hypothetical protein K8T90_13645 [Planctomycetes bacterium]|nr:hypothetical protein [Planctomycetota bacterium]
MDHGRDGDVDSQHRAPRHYAIFGLGAAGLGAMSFRRSRRTAAAKA